MSEQFKVKTACYIGYAEREEGFFKKRKVSHPVVIITTPAGTRLEFICHNLDFAEKTNLERLKFAQWVHGVFCAAGEQDRQGGTEVNLHGKPLPPP